jgi:hypothetical protein
MQLIKWLKSIVIVVYLERLALPLLMSVHSLLMCLQAYR